MVEKFPVSVKAVIYDPKRDAILMIEKLVGSKTKYALPGGLKERGEHPHDTLRRELREELGVDAEPLHPIHVSTYIHPSGEENVGIYFLARLTSTDFKLGSEENQKFLRTVWMDEKEIRERVSEDKYRVFLLELLARARIAHKRAN